MWYSSLSYQMFPYCDGPTPQLEVEKSSVYEVSDERVFEFSFAFVFVLPFVFRLALAFRFAVRFVLAFARRLLLSFVILAIAKIRITKPIPMKTSTAPIPNIQGQTLRFCGAGGGIGDQAGGGAGLCGGGGADLPGEAIACGGAMFRGAGRTAW